MGIAKSKKVTPSRKKPSSKKCCGGWCKCGQSVGQTGASLAAKMKKRVLQLRAIFGGKENWPPALLLDAGKGEGKLGDVRIAWSHFPEHEIKIATRGGKGAPSPARVHARVYARRPLPFHPARRVLTLARAPLASA